MSVLIVMDHLLGDVPSPVLLGWLQELVQNWRYVHVSPSSYPPTIVEIVGYVLTVYEFELQIVDPFNLHRASELNCKLSTLSMRRVSKCECSVLSGLHPIFCLYDMPRRQDSINAMFLD